MPFHTEAYWPFSSLPPVLRNIKSSLKDDFITQDHRSQGPKTYNIVGVTRSKFILSRKNDCGPGKFLGEVDLFLLPLQCVNRDNSSGKSCPRNRSWLLVIILVPQIEKLLKGEIGICSSLLRIWAQPTCHGMMLVLGLVLL